jgi:hypothetical protein
MRSVKRYIFVGAAMLAAGNGVIVPASAATRPAGAASCPACGRNLIANPGAESGLGANGDDVVKVPDWKATGGFTAAQYAWGGGDLSATTPGPKDRGKNYFYGGPAAPRSTGTQVIKIGTRGISSGKAHYGLSAWLGGYADQGDNAALYVKFENSTGASVGSAAIKPVTAAQRHDNSELLFKQTTGSVPAATAEIEVELVMVRKDGSDNDGMADNLSLSLSLPS